MTCSIQAGLSENPSEILVFREFTADLTYDLDFDVLIEVSQDVKDNYYFYLKNLGLLDFVKQLVNDYEDIGGVHIDYQSRRPLTLVTDRINGTTHKNLLIGAAAFKC